MSFTLPWAGWCMMNGSGNLISNFDFGVERDCLACDYVGVRYLMLTKIKVLAIGKEIDH